MKCFIKLRLCKKSVLIEKNFYKHYLNNLKSHFLQSNMHTYFTSGLLLLMVTYICKFLHNFF